MFVFEYPNMNRSLNNNLLDTLYEYSNIYDCWNQCNYYTSNWSKLTMTLNRMMWAMSRHNSFDILNCCYVCKEKNLFILFPYHYQLICYKFWPKIALWQQIPNKYCRLLNFVTLLQLPEDKISHSAACIYTHKNGKAYNMLVSI